MGLPPIRVLEHLQVQTKYLRCRHQREICYVLSVGPDIPLKRMQKWAVKIATRARATTRARFAYLQPTSVPVMFRGLRAASRSNSGFQPTEITSLLSTIRPFQRLEENSSVVCCEFPPSSITETPSFPAGLPICPGSAASTARLTSLPPRWATWCRGKVRLSEKDVDGMIGGLRNTTELRVATREAAQRLQAQLEREMHERKLPIPFMRNGVLYRRTEEGVVAVR